MAKYTDASDDKADAKAGIRENSKKDVALDMKRGVREDEGRKTSTKQTQMGGRGGNACRRI